MKPPLLKPPYSTHSIHNQSGQLVVEYVLLLLVAVTIAFGIRTILVKGGDTPDDAGVILQKWSQMENAIGSDDPNDRQ